MSVKKGEEADRKSLGVDQRRRRGAKHPQTHRGASRAGAGVLAESYKEFLANQHFSQHAKSNMAGFVLCLRGRFGLEWSNFTQNKKFSSPPAGKMKARQRH